MPSSSRAKSAGQPCLSAHKLKTAAAATLCTARGSDGIQDLPGDLFRCSRAGVDNEVSAFDHPRSSSFVIGNMGKAPLARANVDLVVVDAIGEQYIATFQDNMEHALPSSLKTGRDLIPVVLAQHGLNCDDVLPRER